MRYPVYTLQPRAASCCCPIGAPPAAGCIFFTVDASPSSRAVDRVAAGGLLVGAGVGLAGTLVASHALQASLWAIDSVGLVVATTLLSIKYARGGADRVAGGFLVCAIG